MQLAGHWRDLHFWRPNHGARRIGRPAAIYIDQLCYGTKCHPNDILTLMQEHDGWRGSRMNVRAITRLNKQNIIK